MINNPFANAEDLGDAGLILGLGRVSEGGYDNPFQYSCLENPTDEPGRLHSTGSHRPVGVLQLDTTEVT